MKNLVRKYYGDGLFIDFTEKEYKRLEEIKSNPDRNVNSGPNKLIEALERGDIINDYLDGMKPGKIANKYGYSYSSIYRILVEEGIKTVKKGGKRGKKINKRIDDNE